MFLVSYKNIWSLAESFFFLNSIIVMLFTQILPSSFLSRRVKTALKWANKWQEVNFWLFG